MLHDAKEITRAYHRRPEQRANTEAADHEGDGEGNDDLPNMELGLDSLKIASDDRTGEGHLNDGERTHSSDVCLGRKSAWTKHSGQIIAYTT